jgi:hypothetical protein
MISPGNKNLDRIRAYRLGLGQFVLAFLVLLFQHADFLVKGDELRLDFLRQIFASDDPLEITKPRIKITVRIMMGTVSLPEVALPS